MDDDELPEDHPLYRRDLAITYVVLGACVAGTIGALLWRLVL